MEFRQNAYSASEWYSKDCGPSESRSVFHCRLMIILLWQGKLVALEPAALFPVLAISIWFLWYLPVGFARQANCIACGILNILLCLYPNQEQFLLLASSERNTHKVDAGQREGCSGISLSQSLKLVERNTWQCELSQCCSGIVGAGGKCDVMIENLVRHICLT